MLLTHTATPAAAAARRRSIDSIPSWIAWLHYSSLFFYGYDILTTNEVAGLRMNISVRWVWGPCQRSLGPWADAAGAGTRCLPRSLSRPALTLHPVNLPTDRRLHRHRGRQRPQGRRRARACLPASQHSAPAVRAEHTCPPLCRPNTQVLSTFGINASRLTTWIIVLDCLYPAGLLLAALAFLARTTALPRLRGARRRWGAR